MPTPQNRSKLLPARGTKENLQASLPDLLEGEFCYATDENAYYQVSGGFLNAVVGAGTSMLITTEDVQTTDGSPQAREAYAVIPPDLPAGWTELTTQRETNWWLFRETENVANRTTIVEQRSSNNTDRIYALEQNGLPPEQLEGLASVEYVDEQDGALSARIKAVEQDYTTAAEFSTQVQRITDNKKAIEANSSLIAGNTGEISGLQECFDAAVTAAQEGAENLTIELQSYAKKTDAATKEELASVQGELQRADENIQKASTEADTALGELIAANTEAISALQSGEGPDLSEYAKTEDIPTDNAQLANGAQYITAADLPEVPEAPEPPDLSGYATTEQLNGEIESVSLAIKQEEKGRTEADAALSERIDGLESGEGPDLSLYALKSELPTDNAQLENGSGYITAADLPDAPEPPSLDGYATEEYVDDAIAAIEIPEVPPAPDLSGYATTGYVDSATAALPYKIETDKVLRSADAPPKLSRAADGIATAHAGGEIQLVDGEGYFSNITFSGVGGIQTQSDQQGIIIDGSGINDALVLQVSEADDSSFDIENPEQPQRDAEAEAGTMAVLPNIQLLDGETAKGRVWFQGGGGTGVSLDGATIRITTTQLRNQTNSNTARLDKVTPADDEMGRLLARAGAGTSAFTVRNASADNAETMTVSGSGDVVAKSFAGDGSKLTGLPPAQIDWNNLPNLTT